jgi:hypothetical protein
MQPIKEDAHRIRVDSYPHTISALDWHGSQPNVVIAGSSENDVVLFGDL